jgi:MFS family permease
LIGFGTLFISLAWGALFLFAGVCGFGVGGISASQSPIAADYFGLKSHGAIFGAIGGATGILGSLGPFFIGAMFDKTGGYVLSFIVYGCIGLTGLILCSLLKRPHKHLNSIELSSIQ